MNKLHALLLAATFSAPAMAQNFETLVRVGDPVAGAGNVTEVLSTVVNGFAWYARVTTDDPVAGECILELGSKLVGLGDTIGGLTGNPVAEFLDTSHEDIFSSNYLLRLASTPGGTADDEVFTCSFQVILREGDAMGFLGQNFPAGSTWGSFHGVTDAPYTGVYLLRGDLDDPAWSQGPRDYLAFGGYAGSVCARYELSAIAMEGNPLPGLADVVLELFEDEGTFRTDRAVTFGDPWLSLFGCRILTATGPATAVVLHESSQDLATLVAVEGQAAPVPGRTWGDLTSARVEVGGLSTVWALRADLDASDPSSDELLVRNGLKFVQEGDVLAAISPDALVDLGDGAPVIDNGGRVLWIGRWVDSSTGTMKEGLFLDRNLLVETGTTMIEGKAVVALGGDTGSFHIEPFGRFVSFLATLEDGTQGAFRVSLDSVEVYCSAQTSSNGCKPEISWTGNWASASGESPFVLRAQGVSSHVPGLLLYSLTGPASTTVGSANLCLTPPVARRVVAKSGGSLPQGSACDGALQDDFGSWIESGGDPALVPGARVFTQFWVRDPVPGQPSEFRGTNALQFRIAP